jgi:hypothetical protein
MSFDTLLAALAAPEPAEEATEDIHEGADLAGIAFGIIVRAIKDIQSPPKDVPGYNHEAEVERILAWLETPNFLATCTVADLSPRFVAGLIERVCGLTPDMEIVADMSEMIAAQERRPARYTGVDDDLEAIRWGD